MPMDARIFPAKGDSTTTGTGRVEFKSAALYADEGDAGQQSTPVCPGRALGAQGRSTGAENAEEVPDHHLLPPLDRLGGIRQRRGAQMVLGVEGTTVDQSPHRDPCAIHFQGKRGVSVSKRLFTNRFAYYLLVLAALVLSSGAWYKWS
jgi:hypothetical protein